MTEEEIDAKTLSLKTILAVKLSMYRQKNGLSQSAMADLCQVSQGKISKIENGKFEDTSIEFLIRLNLRVNTGFKLMNFCDA